MKMANTDKAIGSENDRLPVVAGLANIIAANAPPRIAPAKILLNRTLRTPFSPALRPRSRPAMYSSEGNDEVLSDKYVHPISKVRIAAEFKMSRSELIKEVSTRAGALGSPGWKRSELQVNSTDPWR